ncbi:MAG: hypothetical protein ACOYJB_00675 [Christensenellaceae bacterium]
MNEDKTKKPLTDEQLNDASGGVWSSQGHAQCKECGCKFVISYEYADSSGRVHCFNCGSTNYSWLT